MPYKQFFRNKIFFPLFIIVLIVLRLIYPLYENYEFRKRIDLQNGKKLIIYLNPDKIEDCSKCIENIEEAMKKVADKIGVELLIITSEDIVESHDWIREWIFKNKINYLFLEKNDLIDRFKLQGVGNYFLFLNSDGTTLFTLKLFDVEIPILTRTILGLNQ